MTINTLREVNNMKPPEVGSCYFYNNQKMKVRSVSDGIVEFQDKLGAGRCTTYYFWQKVAEEASKKEKRR
jgi:hypothetical protein